MSGKSNTQLLLLDLLPPDVRAKIKHSFSVKVESEVILVDGFIFLYSKGNDLCSIIGNKQRYIKKNYDSSRPHMEQVKKFFNDESDDNDRKDNDYHMARKEQGVWSDLGDSFVRLIRDTFKLRKCHTVVLGFDKRQHISKAKSITTGTKRKAQYEKDRKRQIENDKKIGIEPTQNIPFTLDSIGPDKPLPYPWSAVASDKSLLRIVIQYIIMHHLIPDIDRILKEGQTLLIDGHGLGGVMEDADDDTPITIRYGKQIDFMKSMHNTVGEFDHCIYHYIHHYINHGIKTFRILTSDTDIFMMGCWLAESHSDVKLYMQIPIRGKGSAKFDILRIHDLVNEITVHQKFTKDMTTPMRNLTLALYIKSHDYDDPSHYKEEFMKGIGHKRILAAYKHYHHCIGDIAKFDDDVRLEYVRGDSVKKLIYATYFMHYDQWKSDKSRIYPQGLQFTDVILLDDIRDRIQKRPKQGPMVPNDEDIIKKSYRLHFLSALYDDALNGRAMKDLRSISEEDFDEFGYD